MTRDELPNAIGKALIAKYDRYDGEADVIMPLIDQYVAADRERSAQAIEANAKRTLGSYSDGLWRAARLVREGDPR